MRLLLLLFVFNFGTAAFSLAQTGSNLNDCKILEKIMNDPEVRKFLYSRKEFLGFRNASGYFQNCKTLNIDGKAYKISNYTEANTLSYVPIDIIIPNKDFNSIILEWAPMEEAAIFDVTEENGKYNVTFNRIEATN